QHLTASRRRSHAGVVDAVRRAAAAGLDEVVLVDVRLDIGVEAVLHRRGQDVGAGRIDHRVVVDADALAGVVRLQRVGVGNEDSVAADVAPGVAVEVYIVDRLDERQIACPLDRVAERAYGGTAVDDADARRGDGADLIAVATGDRDVARLADLEAAARRGVGIARMVGRGVRVDLGEAAADLDAM